MAGTLAMIDRQADGAAPPKGRAGGAAVPASRLDDAMQRLRDAAAPFIALLSPPIRDSLQGIGRTAEE
jgi:hypothetical protein